jgi:molybdopterin/thiamine biosynthesis adenylyltransferase
MIPDTAAAFDYAEFTSRNFGFVTHDEQRAIRDARVFVCGVGGMGGACLATLARAGIGHVTIADGDRFEVSNLNRQVFATLATVGRDKVEATREQLRSIHPGLAIETRGFEWTDHIDDLLRAHKLVVNGMDDIRCGILLYRKAREHGATVIDAYTAPLPSVTVVRPADPRPEERLGYPSLGRDWRSLTDDEVKACLEREIVYVLTHSSSHRHVVLEAAMEVLAGKRKRMSFAPMVITTGNLMAFEVLRLAMGRPPGTDARGYFFDPWSARIERPRNPLSAWVVGFAVRRFLRSFTRDA